MEVKCVARRRDWNITKQVWEVSPRECGTLKAPYDRQIIKNGKCGTDECPFFFSEKDAGDMGLIAGSDRSRFHASVLRDW